MIFDPNNPDTRKFIDDFKIYRMSDPYRIRAYRACVINKKAAFEAWIEQIGDAELYEQAYLEEL